MTESAATLLTWQRECSNIISNSYKQVTYDTNLDAYCHMSKSDLLAV
jgi:hypothetical protein